MYDPTVGRWLNLDPLGFQAGDMNPNRYVGNEPVTATDPLGLWDSDVHRNLTNSWARFLAGYTRRAADAIAAADEGCDRGATGPYPNQDQSYHFDRGGQLPQQWLSAFNALVTRMGLRGARPTDSRFRHFFEHFAQALNAVGAAVDDPALAAHHLGMALHPLQDWAAHGDHSVFNPGVIGEPHNSRSPQEGTWHLVDNRRLDARGGRDGRPEGLALRTIPVNGGMAVRDWAFYEPGHQRLDLTRDMTVAVLQCFLDFVRSIGGAESKAFFLSD